MIVTIIGATSDVGRELARTFATNGFDLELVARNSTRLTPLKSDIEIKSKVKVNINELDLLKFENYKSVLKPLAITSDVVIFVAGYFVDQALAEAKEEEAIKEMDVNYKAGVLALNVFKDEFQAKGKGTIIGISSVAGERGRAKNYIYGSAKAGFTAYLSGLRNQLCKENIHVLSVLPGFMDTKMTAGLDLPKPITASPETAAAQIFKAYKKQKNIVYVLPIWRLIMLIIRNIPEFIFKKLSI